MPDHFMRRLIEKGDMNQVLEESGKLDVSAQALVMRLREMLQPGFAFIYPANGQRECAKSSGAVIPRQITRVYGLSVPELRKLSKDYGMVTVSEREVHWFRLVDYDSLVPVQDARTTTEILRSAISAVISELVEQLGAFASINGVAGGSLSKERANSAEQALAILRHKFTECKYPQVVQHPDFDLYLRRKAEEWAQKRMAR